MDRAFASIKRKDSGRTTTASAAWELETRVCQIRARHPDNFDRYHAD